MYQFSYTSLLLYSVRRIRLSLRPHRAGFRALSQWFRSSATAAPRVTPRNWDVTANSPKLGREHTVSRPATSTLFHGEPPHAAPACTCRCHWTVPSLYTSTPAATRSVAQALGRTPVALVMHAPHTRTPRGAASHLALAGRGAMLGFSLTQPKKDLQRETARTTGPLAASHARARDRPYTLQPSVHATQTHAPRHRGWLRHY